MSGAPRKVEPDVASEEPPADEEYARTYAAGYEEGLRSALKELLAHASRGHTNQELRALIQSRLARVGDEVDLKRRSLLAPPRRPWEALARPAAPPVLAAPPRGAVAVERIDPGGSVLVCEERPQRALEILRGNLGRFPRVAVVSVGPPELALSQGRYFPIDVRQGGTAAVDHLTPGEVLGRLKEPTESPGGALVYADTFEFFVTADGVDVTLRFAHSLVEQIARTGSGLVASFDRRSVALTDQSRLERAFGRVV